MISAIDIMLEKTEKGGSGTSIPLEGVSPAAHIQRVENRPSYPEDPRNWPIWKKNVQILMVAFHSMVATFMAAGIIPAFDTMAEEYGVTVPQASYLTSIQILVLGLTPFLWKPITRIYGRYHVSLVSVLGSLVCNIGGARCTTYGAQMATRVLTAILISPPIGIGSGVITELCKPEERAQKLGWWTLMSTLGIPAGPFIMGFVTKHIGFKWVYWIYVMINFTQLLVYLLLGEETIYAPGFASKRGPTCKLVPRRIDPRPLKPREFIESIFMYRYPRILVPTIAQCVVFCYANTAITVEMPIAFGQKFHFDAQQIGLQYIAVIIGSLLGEQVSGPTSDWFTQSLSKRRGHFRPADRLWLSYIGFATAIVGLLTWGFQLDNATSWNVTPCIGAAIANFGNQILATILISFAVDCYKDQSTDIGVFVNFVRHIYGFIGPFYFPPMFKTLNLGGAAGVMCAIIGVCALAPVITMHVVTSRRSEWRTGVNEA
ncbi:major facilitator superfamily domain-containing protein [Aspergillus bertholletiae]|uniref:Major facilitator superfamily domain-containing protein n=1 Tax=Aspergillus bertholletiae TaxID=1226010 RepID=A0A5N7ARB8_9EURO|nr:major facilitator superfamily domain-containing protein [Aspergillus bertholletiae]